MKILKTEREMETEKITHDKLHREIFCYKEMYKFAQEKRASRQYILSNIMGKTKFHHQSLRKKINTF